MKILIQNMDKFTWSVFAPKYGRAYLPYWRSIQESGAHAFPIFFSGCGDR